MENNKKLSTGTIIVIIVLALLSALGLVSEFIGTIQNYSTEELLLELIPFCVVFLSVAYYTVAGYKKPHGNLLRNMFLLYAFYCAADMIAMTFYANENGFLNTDFSYSLVLLILMALSAVLTAFVAGRLDKIKKNVLLLVFITVAQIIVCLLILISAPIQHFLDIPWTFIPLFIWLDLVFAYILRYKEHKEAGLTDRN